MHVDVNNADEAVADKRAPSVDVQVDAWYIHGECEATRVLLRAY